MNASMDWVPITIWPSHSEALVTPNLAEYILCVTSLRDKNQLMRALVFVCITEEVAHAHAQNALLECLSSTTGL